MSKTRSFKESQEEDIRELLLGHSVVKVEVFESPLSVGTYSWADGKMTLDNGQEILIIPNDGGCSCGGGDYHLDSLERVDNIITRVDFEVTDVDYATSYRIFVLAGDERINLLSVDGNDGSGYYGTGYELMVEVV